MNKIAILPFKEMPSNCSECIFTNHTGLEPLFKCNVLQKYLSHRGHEGQNVNCYNECHPNCPLISIDIKELSEALKIVGNEPMDRYVNRIVRVNTLTEYNTIKDLLTKLGVK